MRFLVFVLALLSIATADKWALFVSGNSGFWNYCITSTICRGYDLLHDAGVDEDHMIYLGFTDVFDSPENPFPGKVFTEQDPDGPGVDHAAGCRPHIDYPDTKVSAELFMAALSGDKLTASMLTGVKNPKVIESGPDDTIFVYYMDHGAPGFCEVGKNSLTDKALIETINEMYDNKKYKQLVFYFEACYSGSMFANLDKGKNVYAFTGADAEHSAWMCNCPPDDVVNGKNVGTCLSAWYDNLWMGEVTKHGADITNNDMFKLVHDIVDKHTDQNVSQFGDIDTVGETPLKEFIGDYRPTRYYSPEEPDVGNCVLYEDAARNTAKWAAIRSSQANSKAMADYKHLIYDEALKDILIYRAARSYYKDDIKAESVMNSRPNHYDASCVRDLGLALVAKCGYSLPMKEAHVRALQNICMNGAASIDFAEVC